MDNHQTPSCMISSPAPWQLSRSKPSVSDGLGSPELVVDCLVLSHPHSGHLLQYSLPAEGLQTVNLQLRVPEILQGLRALVDLLGEIYKIMLRLRLTPLTSFGPVRSSSHSTALSLITSLGSFHMTAKYMWTIMDCSLSLILEISSITNLNSDT